MDDAQALLGQIEKFEGGPPDRIVSMIEYRGTLVVATEKGVYRLVDGVFRRIAFMPDQVNVDRGFWK